MYQKKEKNSSYIKQEESYINLHKVENIHIEKSNETTWIYVVLNDKKYMTEIFEYNKDFYDCFESPEDLLDEIEERVV